MIGSYLTDELVLSRSDLDDLVPDIDVLPSTGRILPPAKSRPQVVKNHFLPSVEVMWRTDRDRA